MTDIHDPHASFVEAQRAEFDGDEAAMDIDPATEHRDLLQREVDRLTDALDEALRAKEANGALIRSLRAQRVPLQRAIRAMTPRSQRD